MAEECRSCHREIDWAYKPLDAESTDGRTGNRPQADPIDHDSADKPDGNRIVWRDEHGVLRYRGRRKGEEPGKGEHLAMSHFATCPDRAGWRKGKQRWT